MEDWTLRKVELDEAEFFFDLAFRDSHENSPNYELEKMKKRFPRYLQFNLIEDDYGPVCMGGIYEWSSELVRVADRFYVWPEFRAGKRRKGLFNHSTDEAKPAVNLMIPYQTNLAMHLGYQCFISVQEARKRLVTRSLARQLSKTTKVQWHLLDGMYRTAPGSFGIQNVISTTRSISLEKNLEKS